MNRFAISFDDGLLDQFKWARGLYRFEIQGTFYINPFRVGHTMYLDLDQLKRMHDEWGHVIANHFWLHECPKGCHNNPSPISNQVLLRNMTFGAEWLDDHGFEDGSRLVALPFGSVGGGWSKELIKNLLNFCDQIRDVGNGINMKKSRVLNAVETTNIVDAPDDALVCYYFHGNHNTSDTAFVDLLEKLKNSDVEFTSMLKEAQNVQA